MKLSQENARQTVIKQFKFVKTCYVARRLCLMIRTSRAVLKIQDVQKFCFTVANFCKEAGCEEQSILCLKAVAALEEKDEKEYLEWCLKSCKKCGHQEVKPNSSNTIYVA